MMLSTISINRDNFNDCHNPFRQTKILFLIFPALVRALLGQRSPARAANGQF